MVLVLHGVFALLVALMCGVRVIKDETAASLGFYGGVTQLIYVVPLLLVRRGPHWRRFRIGVIIVAGITLALSVSILWALAAFLDGYYVRR